MFGVGQGATQSCRVSIMPGYAVRITGCGFAPSLMSKDVKDQLDLNRHTLQSMPYGNHLMLQPTLWRTCRVLANRTRLRIFVLLLEQPGQTVSTVATRLKLSLPVASQYLRAMEARGLLKVRRFGLRVAYRIADDQTGPVQGLVRAMRQTFRRNSSPAETIFNQATAFTHARRIECFRVLSGRPQTLAELSAATGISVRAIIRHMNKLETRGFVVCLQNQYAVVDRSDAIGRELARLAAGW